VKFGKHLDEDGNLDKKAFSTAVKAEIESWSALDVDKQVLGNAPRGKEVDESLAQEDAEEDKLVDEMLSFDDIGAESTSE